MKYNLLFLIIFFANASFAQNKNQSIGFKENKGQIIDQKGKPNPDVKYLLNTSGLNVQIKTNGFSYDIYETKKHPLTEKQKAKLRPSLHPETEKEKTPDYSLEYIYHRIDIDFVNSNPNVQLITEQKSKDYDNYYNIPNKPEGVLMVHQYQQITYKNIYPNIDVVFSIPKDSLKAVEYNFVVHPKGKISDIQLKFRGAKTELVDNKIRMQVRFGAMEETLPMSWTEDGNDKREIAVGYRKIKNNVYGFESAANVSGKTVVIDPVPTRLWGTYYGGENLDWSTSVFVKDGLVYWTGITYSENNIASSGAYQSASGSSSNGSYDSFLTKLNSDGTRVWGTYYGGDREDILHQVKVSSTDNIYVAGASISNNLISTSGTHQPQKGLYWDGLLAKFDKNGIRQWATYCGGDNNEEAFTLCIDSNEKIYISGETNSGDNIRTIGSHQPNRGNLDPDSYDGFITKFNSNGVREWGTYYGGSNSDGIRDSKLDSTGNPIFLGISYSSNNISTPGAYQEINNGADGFLVKFDSNGNRIWGTYFGGSTDDAFFNFGIDSNDNLYCFGYTNSSSNISTTGVFQEIFKPNSNNQSGCIFKLNKNGFKIWGSYFFPNSYGGSVSDAGDLYFTGRVQNGFQATPNTYQAQPINNNSGNDSYLVKFNTNGKREWATYFSGENGDTVQATAVDNASNIYLAGLTESKTNIATQNTYQPNLYSDTNVNTSSTMDAFLVKFKDCFSGTTATSTSPICIGKTIELKASGGTAYAWTGPNGFTSSVQNPTITNASALNTGKYSCSITGTGGCDGVVDVDVFVGDNQPPVPDSATLPTITGDCKTTITTIPTATDACAGAITATTMSPLAYSLPGNYSVVWKYDDGNGNSVSQNQTVVIIAQVLPTVTSPQPFCLQQNATLSSIAINGQNIKWYDASTNGTLLTNTTVVQNGISYYASQTINGCESDSVPVLINIQNTATPTAISPQTFCASQNPTLDTLVISGTSIKWYDNLTLGNVLVNTALLQNGKTYYAVQTLNGCESPNRLAVTIALIANLPANNYEEQFCDDLNDGNETVDLSSYDAKVISSTSGYLFTYYNSIVGAEKETVSDKITNFSSYKLVLGENKIYVRINSNTPCYAVVELKLTLFSKPVINIQDIVPICENKEITVDAGLGFDDYSWSSGEKSSAIKIARAGNYEVTVTQKHGSIDCSATKNFKVVLSNVGKITTIDTKDWTDNENTILVNIASSSVGDYEYSIDGANYQTSNQFTGLFSGKYSVEVRDKNGCGTDSDEVYLLMFPRYFTPNGDGYNDSWKIKFSDIEVGLSVKIFDRYGKLIKTLASNNDSWNGTFNGNEMPSNDYWFVVKRANGLEYKGHFSLKR